MNSPFELLDHNEMAETIEEGKLTLEDLIEKFFDNQHIIVIKIFKNKIIFLIY